ncbi:MAG: DUF4260 domain-containing protein [Acidimicrobiia bacterium]|nr:DUF4260 domain-containing protein [Acidimicrobiia bacterium]MDQ3500316.1 DUF4260 domain-containing protein [Actinomycetota bacterium]
MFGPVAAQRLEGGFLLALGLYGFSQSGWSWWWFALLFLVPDVSMGGYLLNPAVGATAYNIGHTFFWAGLLLGWYLLGGPLSALATGSIWLAHIGCDRLLGYGLKFPNAFTHTHLGLTGRARGT